MNNVSHHQNLRKRIYTKLEEFPSQNPGKRFLDRLIFVVGALGPLATIPQVYTIFAHHDSSGISVFSWSAYVLFDIVWLTYGIVHKEKVLIFANILWIVVNGLIVIGAIKY